jgi:hypothetical protein
MLRRFAIASAVLLLFVRSAANAAERDYLVRGKEELTTDLDIKYNRAVRHVLYRAWQKDVALRMSIIPGFQPEFAVGIARTASGFTAFEATVADSIWFQLGFGSEKWKHNYNNYRHIKPILHERRLPEGLALRIAALWRRVLTDSRNYARDEGPHTDATQFDYFLAFIPHERLRAYMVTSGPNTGQLITLTRALANYANGTSDRELVKAVAEAERKLGI